MDPDTGGLFPATAGGILGVFWRAGRDVPGTEQLC